MVIYCSVVLPIFSLFPISLTTELSCYFFFTKKNSFTRVCTYPTKVTENLIIPLILPLKFSQFPTHSCGH